jgi:hypothetical protein
MGNRVQEPTINTIIAMDNFSDWLHIEMDKKNVTCDQLAAYIGCERKTVIGWRTKTRAPKLDQMAKCYAYFGKSTIIIPITRIAREEA